MHNVTRVRSTATWCIAASFAVASCSGGSTPAADTVALRPDGDVGVIAESSADDQALDDSNDPGSDRPEGVMAIETPTPEIIVPDAALRCERLGYACSVGDLSADELARSTELLDEIGDAIDREDEPLAGLEAAAAVLADVDDIEEVILDREGYTGLMFRRAGGPAFYAMTEAAAPIGESLTFDELDIDFGELAAAASDSGQGSTPQGFGFRRSTPLVEAYHPAGGPRQPRRALVLDPYATTTVACPDDLPAAVQCVGEVRNGVLFDTERIEGMTVAGIMGSHPQIEVTHLAGAGVEPGALADLGSYDLVHVASHGSSGCSTNDAGWAKNFTDGKATERDTGLPQVTKWADSSGADPNACYSIIGLGPAASEKAAGMPAGIGLAFSGSTLRWVATTEFFASQIGADTVAYLSACTSLDGQVKQQRTSGAFVGWNGFARMSTAVSASTGFWSSMVADGAEFDEAIARVGVALDDQTTIVAPAGWDTSLVGAQLGAIGENIRARDVITADVDAESGGPMRLDGVAGDGAPDTFPFGQEISFVLEGVRNGSQGDVRIDVYGNGTKLASDISLERDGEIIDRDLLWNDWKATVQPNAIELPDAISLAIQQSGTPLELEFRAYEVEDEYTADVSTVSLGRKLKSNGPIPIFTQLAEVVKPAGGVVDGNDLEVRFSSAGGSVIGELNVAFTGEGIGIGTWLVLLDGTFDAESGTMQGTATNMAEGQLPIAPTSSNESGTFTGSVDLDANIVRIQIDIAGKQQDYVGTITPDTGT